MSDSADISSDSCVRGCAELDTKSNNMLLALVVFFLVLGFTGADCPNGCNNITYAGTCVNNACQCNTDTSTTF